MSNSGKSGTQAVERALALLEAVALDAGASPAARIAHGLGLAPSTGRRLLAVLVRKGLIMRIARGRFVAGTRLRLIAAKASPHALLIEVARPVLRRLARQLKCTAHLGLLENEMVTYLVKEGSQTVFTREHNQQEAYCTGIGKALLAQLPQHALDRYLEAPLIPLTAGTIIDPVELRANLTRVRTAGYAIDDREMADDLFCIAAPLAWEAGEHFAISISGHPDQFGAARIASFARMVRARANAIARQAAGRSP